MQQRVKGQIGMLLTDYALPSEYTAVLSSDALLTAIGKIEKAIIDFSADGAIGTDNLADSSVTTDKIVDSNITTDKIADSNITTAKILDANVTKAKLGTDILYEQFDAVIDTDAKVDAWADSTVGSGNYDNVLVVGQLTLTNGKYITDFKRVVGTSGAKNNWQHKITRNIRTR